MDKEEVEHTYSGTSAIKRNKTESFGETWIDLQSYIVKSERAKKINTYM